MIARSNRRTSSDAFAAVADPTRRRIVELLARNDLPVHALAAQFAMSRPAVSKHLRILKDAHVVSEALVGRERVYRLHPKTLDSVAEWVTRYRHFWNQRLQRLGHVLEVTGHE